MQATLTQPTRTELFFVVLPIEPGKAPHQLDAVLDYGDGVQRGWFSDLTREELAERYQCEVGVMDVGELVRLTDDAYRTAPVEISESQWLEALECLPPMRWERKLGVESFRCSEFYSGSITAIYACAGNRYWMFRDNAHMATEEISRRILAVVGGEPA